MSLEIMIREAQEQDIPFLASLSGELGYETSPVEAKGRLARIIKDPAHTVFVAVNSEGFVLAWIHVYRNLRLMNDPTAELGGFIVSERFRNLGVGKQLLSRAEGWAQDHDAKLFIIRTRSTREAAHRFYENAGYEFWKDHKVYRKSL